MLELAPLLVSALILGLVLGDVARGTLGDGQYDMRFVIFPLILRAIGVIASVIGNTIVRTDERRRDAMEVFVLPAFAGEPGALQFQDAAEVDQLRHLGSRQRHAEVGAQHQRLKAAVLFDGAEVNARIRPALDHADGLEDRDRFPHRIPADDEALGKLPFGGQALAGLQAVGIGNFFDPAAGTLGAGGAFHLPIFDSGRLKADLAGATAAVDVAIAVAFSLG